ncbi:PAS domain S-box protein [bacterium]|nr:PAS domain S-box protein [bacterium]
MPEIKKNLHQRILRTVIAITLTVFTLVVISINFKFKEQIQDQIINRDAETVYLFAVMAKPTDYQYKLSTIVSPEIGNDHPITSTPWSSELRGIVALQIFDTKGRLKMALPNDLIPATLNKNDLKKLQQLIPISRFHDEIWLDSLFSDPQALLNETTVPLLEIIIPVTNRDGSDLFEIMQFWIDGKSMATELSLLNRTVFIQTAVALICGYAILLAILIWGFRRLTSINHALSIEVDQRKEAENEVLKLRNQLNDIFNSMPSIIISVDSSLKIVNWNQSAEIKTNIPQNQAIGKNFTEILPQLANLSEQIRFIMKTGNSVTDSKTARHVDGKVYFDSISIFPLITEYAEGAVIRIDDVTDRIRMEEMMVQSEKLRSVSGLAAGMAHEINNPLGIILQTIQNMERRLSPDFHQNIEFAEKHNLNLTHLQEYLKDRNILNYLKAIRISGNRAANIIKDMLRFSRKSESEFAKVNIIDVMKNSLKLAMQDYDLRKKYDFKHIRIIREFQPVSTSIPCAETEIEQVFLNLLKNAAYALAELKGEKTPEIFIRINTEGNMCRIEIEDNGPGMEEEVRLKVFEPFFTTKPVGDGTGLGLSVSYLIVTNNHMGTMEVKSEPGNGTRFIVKLPLERPPLSTV